MESPSNTASGVESPSNTASGVESPSNTASGVESPSNAASGVESPSNAASGVESPFNSGKKEEPSSSAGMDRTVDDEKEDSSIPTHEKSDGAPKVVNFSLNASAKAKKQAAWPRVFGRAVFE